MTITLWWQRKRKLLGESGRKSASEQEATRLRQRVVGAQTCRAKFLYWLLQQKSAVNLKARHKWISRSCQLESLKGNYEN
ncbi:hypothetical protein C7Y66_22370 [Chroococcidiopsis sp. CCALA 051]|nr:hypothetical protein C7Y66_22370 [Chroococcidiopsis sp. CCALA 051]